MSRPSRRWLLLLPLLLFVLAGLVVWSAREHAARDAGDALERAAQAAASRSAADGEGAGSELASRPDAGPLEVSASARQPIVLSAARARSEPRAAGGAVSGVVVGRASGRAIADAELTFAHAGTTRSVRSAADGTFTYAPSPAEPARASEHALALATAPGHLPFAPEWGHSPVRMRLGPGVHLEGVRVTLVEEVRTTVSVVSVDGEPVAGAAVRAYGLAHGERALAPLPDAWTTGGEGEVVIVAPDGALLEASHAAHGRGRARLDTAAQVSHRVRIALGDRGGAPGSIAGRVLDVVGRPIAGAIIEARHVVVGGRDLFPVVSATSGADGAFRLEGADPGPHRLEAVAWGFARGTRGPVAAGEEGVELRLEREGRLVVRVLGADGEEPLVAASVVVERSVGALELELLAYASAYSADGRIEIGGLPPGPCRVTASSPGRASASADAVARAGAEDAVVLRLGGGAAVAGRVVSGLDGAALPGARVTLEGRLGEGSSAVPLHVSATSDEDGRFELRGVPEGVASVIVLAEGHHGRVRSGIVVPDGGRAELEPIDLTPLADGEAPGIELAGIGAILAAAEDVLAIRDVVEGGGAAEVGLGPGDAILAIDGRPVSELGFAGCVERIRGPEGTRVRLLVRREGAEQASAIDVPRRRVRA